MLAAEEPDLAEGLLLLSYPLHPPRQPEKLRTAHFPSLRTPAVFLHGTKDDFGSPDELRRALELIPAHVELITVEGSGHDLKKARFDDVFVKKIIAFYSSGPGAPFGTV